MRQGRQAVYDARTRRRSVVRFFVTDYWRLIAARRKALLVAFVLLFGSAALAALWARPRSGGGDGRRPARSSGRRSSRVTRGRDMSPAQQAAFTSEVFTNNIQVTLVAFAGGITRGIGTALALLYNGLLLGVDRRADGSGRERRRLRRPRDRARRARALVHPRRRRGRPAPRLGDHLARPAHAPRLAAARGGRGAARSCSGRRRGS